VPQLTRKAVLSAPMTESEARRLRDRVPPGSQTHRACVTVLSIAATTRTDCECRHAAILRRMGRRYLGGLVLVGLAALAAGIAVGYFVGKL